MTSEEEFKKYYRRKLLPVLKEFNEARKKYYGISNAIGWASFITITGAVVFTGIYLISSKLIVCGCIAPVALCLFFWISSMIKSFFIRKTGYYEKFQSDVTGKIIQVFPYEISYNPSGCLERFDFFDSDLFEEGSYPSFKGNDYFNCIIEGVSVEIANINATFSSYRSSKIKTGSFNGIFSIATFSENFKKDITMNIMDDNYLDIKGLLPENFTELCYTPAEHIWLSVKENKLHIAINGAHCDFEPHLEIDLLSYINIEQPFKYFQFIFNIIEGLLVKKDVFQSDRLKDSDFYSQKNIFQDTNSTHMLPSSATTVITEEGKYTKQILSSEVTLHPVKCPSCGEINHEITEFCSICGYKIN